MTASLRRLTWRAAGLLAGTLAAPALALPAKPSPPAWRDTAGRSYGPREIRAAQATVFYFGSTTCPCADRYNARVAALAGTFAARGARFFQVFSAPGVKPAEVSRYVESRKIELPVVHDAGGALARRLGARSTPTAVVLDSAGRVRYRGRVDDNPDPQAVVRKDLEEALAQVLDARAVRLAATLSIGCGLTGGPAASTIRPKLRSGVGPVEFRITTSSPEAQRFFNQGLNQWFGFNFPEAEAAFREAARLDPQCAMAYWGTALSMGMTYNYDFDPKRLPEAEELVRRAVRLSAAAKPKERALIEALAVRHTPGKEMLQQLSPYHEAMAAVYSRYRDDVNVAVLYAASGMDLRPWKLWSPDGRPEPGTMEVLLVLEDALRRDPNHTGANHYYIHATEASPTPERALPSLGRLAAQAPQSGHLVHMPSHTLIRMGDYRGATAINERAADLDAEYFKSVGRPTGYGGYYIHNLDFVVACQMIEGRSQDAIASARRLAREAARWAPVEAPVFCGGASGIMAVYSRFGKWDEILKAPAPLAENPFANLSWRYARGMALAAKGDLAGAENELALLEAAQGPVAAAAAGIPLPGMGDGIIQAGRAARAHLAGKIAAGRGDAAAAERRYRDGVKAEDAIPYTEPPPWRHPLRESLGALQLTQGRAAEAEATFREELKLRPRSGRALFGLHQALEKQGKTAEAARVKAEFQQAWERADVKLTVSDL